MSKFLQFLFTLNTSGIAKTCPLHFLHDYYGYSPDVTFPQFSNHFQPFHMVSPHVSLIVFLRIPQVFLLFPLSVSLVSYFRFSSLKSLCLRFSHKNNKRLHSSF